MQLDAFEAALRLIMPGPGDQPLMRILRIAMDLSECSAGLIGVRRPDRFETIISSGIPLAAFQQDLARSEALARRLRMPCTIADASLDVDFKSHPYVTGPAGWRFIASVPVPLRLLDLDLVLNCADPRVDLQRRPDLLALLEESAAVVADELRLIGDIALQSERISEVRTTSAMRAAGVSGASVPMALIDRDLRIQVANDRLALLLSASEPVINRSLGDLFPVDAAMIERELQKTLTDGTPASAVVARAPGRDKTYLLDLIRVVSADSQYPQVLCTVSDRSRTFAKVDQLRGDGSDSNTVVSDFLLSTLVWQKRLLRRGRGPYHALSRWRASVREPQLAAIKALKRDPGGYFLDELTDRMCAAATALFGRDTFRAVVPVPCGNSGANCLSSRLAARIAERLDVDFIDAFAPIATTGSSHPRRNVGRPSMQLITAPKVPILLIDDIATSGAHIEEAATLLAEHAPAVLPLVWIAD